MDAPKKIGNNGESNANILISSYATSKLLPTTENLVPVVVPII